MTAQSRTTPPPATALIAEDEPLLARALQAELARTWPSLQILAVASNGRAALAAILEHQPDVVFLDIRMPLLSGIEVAAAMIEDLNGEQTPPLLVFVTAYDQFAVDAFRHAAVDYLLKPVEPARLEQTVARLQQRLAERPQPMPDGLPQVGPGAGQPALDALVEQLRPLLTGAGAAPSRAPAAPAGAGHGHGQPGADTTPLRVIRVAVGDTVRMIPIDEVRYLQAVDKYVNVVSSRGEALIRESLRDLIGRLDPERFVQIHRSTVVNLDHVLSATRDERGHLQLELAGRDERLTVSRLYAHLFKAM